ncbi:MAG: T9SS type A sorting domain-containing protein [Chitinophagaceae bacterium]|nr:T9SS type A sorting domain-containing protein [Chitinophagaceae bacterium]
MKQLIILLAAMFTIASSITAHPTFEDKKPAARSRFPEDIKNQLLVTPNPKTGNALVRFTSEKAGKGMIVVLDETGNTVLKQQVVLLEGKNKINVNNFVNLAEGYYTVCLNTQHKTYSAPFLLWK